MRSANHKPGPVPTSASATTKSASRRACWKLGCKAWIGDADHCNAHTTTLEHLQPLDAQGLGLGIGQAGTQALAVLQGQALFAAGLAPQLFEQRGQYCIASSLGLAGKAGIEQRRQLKLPGTRIRPAHPRGTPQLITSRLLAIDSAIPVHVGLRILRRLRDSLMAENRL
ncbi:hypothetical protein WR25_09845 [Diploscapter pachys]|uniref:Uncharacterized protein n=1 Tax=Diploscapter pachys TaxID=2018661 RepID=A0A2A2KBL3_9BILA|nr:hypothetical protein WR25_09845 [Diploscapter pachys]